MGYNDFFKREDVYKIIGDTLSSHYKCTIRFTSRFQINKNKRKYYCLPRLNIIFSNQTSKKKLLQFTANNVLGNQKFYKKTILKIYVYLSILFPVIFADRIMVFSNNSDLIDVIYPGNKRLKIINFKEMSITNILKKGFNNEWFNNEISFRTNSSFDFVLKIRDVGEDYYTEKLIFGKPLARMNKKIINEITSKVLKYLSEISEDSSRIKIGLYTHEIANQLDSLIESVEEPFKNINIIIKMLTSYLISNHQNEEVTVSRTHGDFQKGNVIIDEYGKIFLLDWETIDIRYSNYDYLIYTFDLRNSNNLINNIKEIIKCKDSHDDTLVHLSLFILEDIKWYYNETKQLLKGNFSTGLVNYNDNRLLDFLKGVYRDGEKTES